MYHWLLTADVTTVDAAAAPPFVVVMFDEIVAFWLCGLGPYGNAVVNWTWPLVPA